ncbi:MAG: NUDIX hydrolase [Bacteroidetes bacterium]|nr:NUDIX hydrolase [Bacteroidota bacterium]
MQYITIYFDDRPLFLTDRVADELLPYAHHDDTVLIDEFSHHAVNAMIHEMRKETVHAGIFVGELQALKHAFWKKFMVIKAGGGLVRNGSRELLFMLRRGVWDLPKGKLDPGETLEQCAVREVMEETGLRGVQLDGPLLETYHTYEDHGHHILKETYWYNMSVSGEQTPIPQQEEQITELRWVLPENVGEQLANTYPSIRDVLTAAFPLK